LTEPVVAERSELSATINAFVTNLREQHAFPIGHSETHDALAAVEIVGVADATRVRCALRLICCASPEQIAIFERAFDAFFLAPRRGVRNPSYAPRHTRAEGGTTSREARAPKRRDPQARQEPEMGTAVARERVPVALDDDAAVAWEALRGRFSPTAGAAEAPAIASDGFEAMLEAASRLLAGVTIGRSRRWKPQPQGNRFDLRRTLRASLHTGGDPVFLHRLGHPLRNPRFVILIDGSRSMAEHAAPVLQFAAALCRRSRRADAFLFSTELRDVTRALRRARPGDQLTGLGEAWGGGTRIGASLLRFVRSRGVRLLGDDTVVIVFSDGFDVGDRADLERAMRELDRRSAAVVWLNPHLALPGYEPTAGAMQLALPYVSLLASAAAPAAFKELTKRISRACRT